MFVPFIICLTLVAMPLTLFAWVNRALAVPAAFVLVVVFVTILATSLIVAAMASLGPLSNYMNAFYLLGGLVLYAILGSVAYNLIRLSWGSPRTKVCWAKARRRRLEFYERYMLDEVDRQMLYVRAEWPGEQSTEEAKTP